MVSHSSNAEYQWNRKKKNINKSNIEGKSNINYPCPDTPALEPALERR